MSKIESFFPKEIGSMDIGERMQYIVDLQQIAVNKKTEIEFYEIDKYPWYYMNDGVLCFQWKHVYKRDLEMIIYYRNMLDNIEEAMFNQKFICSQLDFYISNLLMYKDEILNPKKVDLNYISMVRI